MRIFHRGWFRTVSDDLDRYNQRCMALSFLDWVMDPVLLVWHHVKEEEPYHCGITDESLRDEPPGQFMYLLGLKLQELVVHMMDREAVPAIIIKDWSRGR